MQKRNYHYLTVCLLAVILLTSCASTKKITYHQDAERFTELLNMLDSSEYSLRIKSNDNLLITVNSRNPKAVEEFNSVSFERGGASTASLDWRGYLVDEDGNINFPVFGKIYVKGLNKAELSNLLEERIRDPVVNDVM